MTVGLAFSYFFEKKVDIAVIEVGMGGRLDGTNLIQPEFCVITNIGWDHMQFLGDSLAEITRRKSGYHQIQYPCNHRFNKQKLKLYSGKSSAVKR